MSRGAGALAWALLLLLGVIWGSSFMLTNVAVREIPPLTLAALRLVFAALLLAGAAALLGARAPRGRRVWAAALFCAAFGTVIPFQLISWAQLHVPSAMTGLLMAPMPLLSLLLARLTVPGEPFGAARLAGFGAGLVGVLLLVGPEALVGGGGEAALGGQLASLAAMALYAVNGVVLAKAGAVDPLGMAAAILGLSALMALPPALIVEAPALGAISPEGWALVAALGAGATAAGQILLIRIIALAGAPFLSTVNYQVPLWSAGFGAMLLGEALAPAFWAALALILAGLGLAQRGATPPSGAPTRSAPRR